MHILSFLATLVIIYINVGTLGNPRFTYIKKYDNDYSSGNFHPQTLKSNRYYLSTSLRMTTALTRFFNVLKIAIDRFRY